MIFLLNNNFSNAFSQYLILLNNLKVKVMHSRSSSRSYGLTKPLNYSIFTINVENL